MKKIKVIVKTLLIAALVASSTQMSASARKPIREPIYEGPAVDPIGGIKLLIALAKIAENYISQNKEKAMFAAGAAAVAIHYRAHLMAGAQLAYDKVMDMVAGPNAETAKITIKRKIIMKYPELTAETRAIMGSPERTK